MTKILVMTYGHEWWNKAADFAEHCSWRAGKTLADMMRRNAFAENEQVIAALCNGQIAGFCTFSNRDELPVKYPFSPFAGFVFVDERFRGQRLSEKLISAACKEAKKQGFDTLYIMSGEKGLYEKYGFEKNGEYETVYGTRDQLFAKKIL